MAGSGRLIGRARHDQPVGLADAPEVERQHEDQQSRQHGGVQHVEVHQGRRSGLRPAQHPGLEHAADARQVIQHRRTDRHGPESDLVPRQQIAGEIRQQHAGEQGDADQPVQAPRGIDRAGVEHAQQVEKRGQHQQVAAPAMEIADQLAERYLRLQVEDRIVGAVRKRLEHEL
jgi:hypothetical protein